MERFRVTWFLIVLSLTVYLQNPKNELYIGRMPTAENVCLLKEYVRDIFNIVDDEETRGQNLDEVDLEMADKYLKTEDKPHPMLQAAITSSYGSDTKEETAKKPTANIPIMLKHVIPVPKAQQTSPAYFPVFVVRVGKIPRFLDLTSLFPSNPKNELYIGRMPTAENVCLLKEYVRDIFNIVDDEETRGQNLDEVDIEMAAQYLYENYKNLKTEVKPHPMLQAAITICFATMLMFLTCLVIVLTFTIVMNGFI